MKPKFEIKEVQRFEVINKQTSFVMDRVDTKEKAEKIKKECEDRYGGTFDEERR